MDSDTSNDRKMDSNNSNDRKMDSDKSNVRKIVPLFQKLNCLIL